jgi:hypothetical protein
VGIDLVLGNIVYSSGDMRRERTSYNVLFYRVSLIETFRGRYTNQCLAVCQLSLTRCQARSSFDVFTSSRVSQNSNESMNSVSIEFIGHVLNMGHIGPDDTMTSIDERQRRTSLFNVDCFSGETWPIVCSLRHAIDLLG